MQVKTNKTYINEKIFMKIIYKKKMYNYPFLVVVRLDNMLGQVREQKKYQYQ